MDNDNNFIMHYVDLCTNCGTSIVYLGDGKRITGKQARYIYNKYKPFIKKSCRNTQPVFKNTYPTWVYTKGNKSGDKQTIYSFSGDYKIGAINVQ